MIHIREIDHVVLRTTALDEMLTFYRTVIGCTNERSEPELGLYQLRAGRSLIDIVPVDSQLGQDGGAAPGKDAHNMDHVCLRVEPFNGAAILNFLDEHQVAHSDIERRYGAEGFGPSIYCYDPEGNRVELKGPPEK